MIEGRLPEEKTAVTDHRGGRPPVPWKPGQAVGAAIRPVPVFNSRRGLAKPRPCNWKNFKSMVTASCPEGGVAPTNSRWHRTRPRVEVRGERLWRRAGRYGDLH